jgi:hypothetical protein
MPCIRFFYAPSLCKYISTMRIITLIFMFITSVAFAQMSESYTDKSAGFNGSFDFIKEGLPVNWLAYTPKTTRDAKFVMSVDTHDVAEGKHAMKWKVEHCSATGGWMSPGLAKEFLCTPGTTYLIEFWIKNTGASFRFKTDAVSSKYNFKGPEFNSNERTDVWKKVTQKITVPANFSRLRIEFSILGSGTVWLDNVSVKKVKQ